MGVNADKGSEGDLQPGFTAIRRFASWIHGRLWLFTGSQPTRGTNEPPGEFFTTRYFSSIVQEVSGVSGVCVCVWGG